MNVKLMDIQRQHAENAKEYEAAALAVMQSGNYILSENIKSFEKEFAEYIGVKHAVSVANGSDALYICLLGLGIEPGDEVITTPFTFIATSEAITRIGAKPVFVDINPDTYNIDENEIEKAITVKTKAILPVHLYGKCCNMDKINSIAKQYNLKIVEDACQAAGSSYHNRKAGSLGDAACFSFFPTKTLGCEGDGGIITTNDDDLAEICFSLRSHGFGVGGIKAYNKKHPYHPLDVETSIDVSAPKYFNFLTGCNSRLDEIQAAILRKKLPKLDSFVSRRRDHAAFYTKELANCHFKLPVEDKDCVENYYVYVIQHPEAKKIMEYLHQNGIGSLTYYPRPLHIQAALCDLGYRNGDFPHAEKAALTTFAIPVYPELTAEEREFVVKTLKEYK